MCRQRTPTQLDFRRTVAGISTALSRTCTGRTQSLQPYPPTSLPLRPHQHNNFCTCHHFGSRQVVTMFGKKSCRESARAAFQGGYLSSCLSATTVWVIVPSPHTLVSPCSTVAHIKYPLSSHRSPLQSSLWIPSLKSNPVPHLSHTPTHTHTHTHTHAHTYVREHA